MRFQVIEEHKSNNAIPITVSKEERIRIGKQSDVNDGWLNWIYCYSLDGHSEGWIPEQIIRIEGNYGAMLEDYSAKELEVKEGDAVHGENELNGWIWCSNSNTKEEGWLPKEKLTVV